MPIQNIKANKTASLTDLRDPMKVIEAAGSEPIAIMNRNKVIGYFVPENSATEQAVSDEAFTAALSQVMSEEKAVLDYLKDK